MSRMRKRGSEKATVGLGYRALVLPSPTDIKESGPRIAKGARETNAVV